MSRAWSAVAVPPAHLCPPAFSHSVIQQAPEHIKKRWERMCCEKVRGKKAALPEVPQTFQMSHYSNSEIQKRSGSSFFFFKKAQPCFVNETQGALYGKVKKKSVSSRKPKWGCLKWHQKSISNQLLKQIIRAVSKGAQVRYQMLSCVSQTVTVEHSGAPPQRRRGCWSIL